MLLSYTPTLRTSQQQQLRLILASSSPRRQQLMQQLLPGCNIAAIASTFAENLPHAEHTPQSYAQATSYEKAKEVWDRVHPINHNEKDHTSTGTLLISADTVIVRDDAILEKPANAEAAFAMLKSLSGRSHHVVTGVTIMSSSTMSTDATSIESVKANNASTTTTTTATVGSSSTSTSTSSANATASSTTSTSSSHAAPTPTITRFTVSTRVTFVSLPDSVIHAYVASGEPFDKAGGYGYQSLAATFVEGIEGCYYNVVGLPLTKLAQELIPHLERLIAGGNKEAIASTSAASSTPSVTASSSSVSSSSASASSG